MKRAPRYTAVQAGVFATLVACWSACGDSDRAGEAGRASLDSRHDGIDSVHLDPAQVFGLVSGDPQYLFGSITSLATDAAGRIYVGDGSPTSVRLFDHNGSFLVWIAREGGGPGEVEQRAANLILGADGRLYVRDARRITVFARRAGAEIADSVVAVWNTRRLGNTTSDRSGLARDGR